MSFNLGLDTNTRDLKLTPGKNLSIVESPENVAQQIECRLETFRGEWFLDNTLGVPFFAQVLLKTNDKARLGAVFKAEILKLSEVIRIEQLESNIDKSTRTYNITKLVVKVQSGETVTVGGL